MQYELINDELLQVETVITENQSATVKTHFCKVYGYDNPLPVVFEAIPEVQEVEGKVPVLTYANGALSWIYMDAPEAVEVRVVNLEVVVDALLGGA